VYRFDVSVEICITAEWVFRFAVLVSTVIVGTIPLFLRVSVGVVCQFDGNCGVKTLRR
jgi:hypothetical protein